MDFDIDDLWSVFCAGWRAGRFDRERRPLSLYASRPGECDRRGGPCIGRPECASDDAANPAVEQ